VLVHVPYIFRRDCIAQISRNGEPERTLVAFRYTAAVTLKVDLHIMLVLVLLFAVDFIIKKYNYHINL